MRPRCRHRRSHLGHQRDRLRAGYWEFDRGGPVARALAIKPYPDFEFPQMTSPELAPPSWEPMFADYFYLSFTNATAFSPTDVHATVPLGQDAHAAPVGGFAAPGGPGHRQAVNSSASG